MPPWPLSLQEHASHGGGDGGGDGGKSSGGGEGGGCGGWGGDGAERKCDGEAQAGRESHEPSSMGEAHCGHTDSG